jgi:peroxiredoxin
MKAMSRAFLAACIAATGAALTTSATGGEGKETARLNQPAPDFTLIDSKGQQRSLSDYQGRIVVLEWINPDCPYVANCYKSKAMQKAYARVKALSKDAVWLAVNTTNYTGPDQNNLWIDKYGLKYPILLDTEGTVGRMYDARRTPHMFVIDAEGVLRYHGAIDNDPFRNEAEDKVVNHVTAAVGQVVEGETVAPDYIKPYGCSVKFKPKRN